MTGLAHTHRFAVRAQLAEVSADPIPRHILARQERVRDAGLCGDAEKFWRQPGIYVERLPDDGLRIWIDGKQRVLEAERAESLLQWMDRSR